MQPPFPNIENTGNTFSNELTAPTLGLNTSFHASIDDSGLKESESGIEGNGSNRSFVGAEFLPYTVADIDSIYDAALPTSADPQMASWTPSGMHTNSGGAGMVGTTTLTESVPDVCGTRSIAFLHGWDSITDPAYTSSLTDHGHFPNIQMFPSFEPSYQAGSNTPSILGGGTATASLPPSVPPVVGRVLCLWGDCTSTFGRLADRNRHVNSVHLGVSQGQAHLCPIVGCDKSYGKGYSRADKVTEHLWKRHGDLGYRKGI
jgi:hypothetical protein